MAFDWLSFSQVGFGAMVTALAGYATNQVISAKKIAQENKDDSEKRLEEIEKEISKWVLSTEKSVADIRVATEATLNMLRMDQHSFQLRTMESFASARSLKDVESRIMKCLDALDAKFDRLMERELNEK
jgi:hypothetical protein